MVIIQSGYSKHIFWTGDEFMNETSYRVMEILVLEPVSFVSNGFAFNLFESFEIMLKGCFMILLNA